MATDPREMAELVERQAGVVARQQLLDLGMSSSAIAHRVRSSRWASLHPGVYLTLPGRESFLVPLWGALLHAGPSAVASHRSAGLLQGLVDRTPSVVDVAVAEIHRVQPRPGIRVHRKRFLVQETRPAASVPQTRLEVTLLDLVGESRTTDDVVGWLTRACQRRLTTPPRIVDALARRSRQRWRHLVSEVLGAVSDVVSSPLELRYRALERLHGLPPSEANARSIVRGTNRYTDVLHRRSGCASSSRASRGTWRTPDGAMLAGTTRRPSRVTPCFATAGEPWSAGLARQPPRLRLSCVHGGGPGSRRPARPRARSAWLPDRSATSATAFAIAKAVANVEGRGAW